MKQDYKEYEEKIKMNDNLKFDAERGETRTYEAAGKNHLQSLSWNCIL